MFLLTIKPLERKFNYSILKTSPKTINKNQAKSNFWFFFGIIVWQMHTSFHSSYFFIILQSNCTILTLILIDGWIQSKWSELKISLCSKARALKDAQKPNTRWELWDDAILTNSKLFVEIKLVYDVHFTDSLTLIVYCLCLQCEIERNDHTAIKFETYWRVLAGFVVNVHFDADSVQIRCCFVKYCIQFCFLYTNE